MKQRYLKIPLINNRYINIRFTQNENMEWICVMSDETMQDLTTYINTGYYKLNSDDTLSVTDL
jgi:mannose/fructose-specific phosphotransferase system component IIA